MSGMWIRINKAIGNTSAMPQILSLTVRAAMVTGPLLIIFALLPLVPWTIDGKVMSGEEAWASGFAPMLITWLVLVTFAAWGIALRRPQSRWVAVALPLASMVLAMSVASVSLADMAFSVGMAICIYLYLFHARSVCRYFSGEGKN